jgi:hypothetical protein
MGACRPCHTSFLCTQSRNWETHCCFWKTKIVGVDKVEDDYELTLVDTYYTKEKDKKSFAQNSGICIKAIDPQGLKTTYYGYIQDIW